VTATDELLMQKVAEGDLGAFRALMGRGEGAAKRYAYRIFGDYQLAEDTAQEAFVRVFRAADRYEPTARFSTYFYTVLGNLCRDRLRSARRRADSGGIFEEGVQLDDVARGRSWERPDREAERAEERQLVREAVGGLPAKLMEAVSLREFEGLSYQEIADVMHANLGEVKTWIHRGRKMLGGRLESILRPEDSR
jgi:RNA polymerase sigma-70 factor (ECF subfamily)